MRGSKLAKNKLAVTSKKKGYESRVAKYQGWFSNSKKNGGKPTIDTLNSIMEEMTTTKCLDTHRENSYGGYPITKIKVGLRGGKLRKIHERDNTRLRIFVPDVKANKKNAAAAKRSEKKKTSSSKSASSRSKAAAGKRKKAAANSSSSNTSKRQKNGKSSGKSASSAVAIDEIMEDSAAAAAQASKKTKAKKKKAASGYDELASVVPRIDSSGAMRELKHQLEESLRAAITGVDAGKSRKRKLHNVFSQKLLQAIAKMCPTELSHMNFFLDKGLRVHVNAQFGQLVVATVNKFLMEHPDTMLEGEFPKVSQTSVNALQAEAMESSYFSASQVSAPGASPALKKKVKKKTVKSAGVGMFIDSDDDDFELANMDIPKSKTLVHDLT